jgi:signal peptidase I
MNKPMKNRRKLWFQIITAVIAVFILVIIGGILFLKAVPGYGLYFVKSGSMEPTINVGDIVITGPADKIAAGDIITFENNESVVTHRVVTVEGDQVTTKGDANKAADTSKTGVSQIKGRYLFKIPAVGYLTNLIGTRQGWFLVVIVPTIILVAFLVKDIVKEAFKDDKKKAAAKASAAGSSQTTEQVIPASTLAEKATQPQANTQDDLQYSTVKTDTAAPVQGNKKVNHDSLGKKIRFILIGK